MRNVTVQHANDYLGRALAKSNLERGVSMNARTREGQVDAVVGATNFEAELEFYSTCYINGLKLKLFFSLNMSSTVSTSTASAPSPTL